MKDKLIVNDIRELADKLGWHHFQLEVVINHPFKRIKASTMSDLWKQLDKYCLGFSYDKHGRYGSNETEEEIFSEILCFLRTAFEMSQTLQDYAEVAIYCDITHHFSYLRSQALEKWNQVLLNTENLVLAYQELKGYADSLTKMSDDLSRRVKLRGYYGIERLKKCCELYPMFRVCLFQSEDTGIIYVSPLSRKTKVFVGESMVDIEHEASRRIYAEVEKLGLSEAICYLSNLISKPDTLGFDRQVKQDCIKKVMQKVASFQDAYTVYKTYKNYQAEAAELMNKFASSFEDKYECLSLTKFWSEDYDKKYKALLFICDAENQIFLLWGAHLDRVNSLLGSQTWQLIHRVATIAFVTFQRLVQVNPQYKNTPAGDTRINQFESQIAQNYSGNSDSIDLITFYRIRSSTISFKFLYELAKKRNTASLISFWNEKTIDALGSATTEHDFEQIFLFGYLENNDWESCASKWIAIADKLDSLKKIEAQIVEKKLSDNYKKFFLKRLLELIENPTLSSLDIQTYAFEAFKRASDSKQEKYLLEKIYSTFTTKQQLNFRIMENEQTGNDQEITNKVEDTVPQILPQEKTESVTAKPAEHWSRAEDNAETHYETKL
ncbi:MAG: hypothetical protein WCG55_00625 [bacterium]